MAIATINPATGQVLKTFEPLSDAQLEQKIQRAADAFPKHRKMSFADRAQRMAKAGDILESDKETFARMMTTEMGKTFRSAVDEALKCAWVCRYYAENAERFLADEVVETPATRSYVRYQPLGAVLAVMPWNYPFWQVIRAAAPAIMAGNVMLLKHSSNVPQCALMIEDLYRRAGFAEGVFQTLLIGSQKVDQILNDPAYRRGHAHRQRRCGYPGRHGCREAHKENRAGTRRQRSFHRDAQRKSRGSRRLQR